MIQVINTELIGMAVYFALTFLVELIPPLRKQWDKIQGEWKPLVLLVTAIVLVAAATGLACLGIDTGSGIVCPERSFVGQFVVSALLGLVVWTASQMTFPSMQAAVADRVKYRHELGHFGFGVEAELDVEIEDEDEYEDEYDESLGFG